VSDMNGSISTSTVTAQTYSWYFPGKQLSPAQRWISLAELVAGSAIVIGHNVYHVIPNEVPILFVLGLLSAQLRDGSWTAMGLRWPASWRRTILFALAAAALRILLSAFVIDPITAHFWPPAIAPSGMNEIAGNWKVALQWFLIVWTFAACGEEIGYRGYLLRRAADAGWNSGGGGALRLWTLLQRPGGHSRFRHGRLDSCGCLCLVGGELVGLHSGARIY
jgi:membrane protease YdiL (CAAX protease family)